MNNFSENNIAKKYSTMEDQRTKNSQKNYSTFPKPSIKQVGNNSIETARKDRYGNFIRTRTHRVSFKDRVCSEPLHTVHEVEKIVYPEMPVKQSSRCCKFCLLF